MVRSRVTLRDVARHVGVHPSTVSRVLNPRTRSMVSSEIAGRVDKAAGALHYRPNPIAYGLRTNHSFTVGVVVPDLTNPVFPPIIRGLENTLEEAGYTAIVANSDNDRVRERTIVERMRGRSVDGLVFATAHRDDPLVSECIDDEIPLVLLNNTLEDDAAASVVSDDCGGIQRIVEHLAGLGHKRFAHIAGPQDTSTALARYRGLLDAVAERGLSCDPELVVFCDAYSVDEGRRASEELLRARESFTAIVAANDLLALGCYDSFASAGIDCPADISLTGFNDMPFMDKVNPPLTTIRIPHYRMGAEAGRILIEHMNGSRNIAAAA
ncbi:MAG: LacI family DNA-binding transcriptional regulator, partial [Alphaproteobacteria bacterium]